jgi:hypothetical protein
MPAFGTDPGDQRARTDWGSSPAFAFSPGTKVHRLPKMFASELKIRCDPADETSADQ